MTPGGEYMPKERVLGLYVGLAAILGGLAFALLVLTMFFAPDQMAFIQGAVWVFPVLGLILAYFMDKGLT